MTELDELCLRCESQAKEIAEEREAHGCAIQLNNELGAEVATLRLDVARLEKRAEGAEAALSLQTDRVIRAESDVARLEGEWDPDYVTEEGLNEAASSMRAEVWGKSWDDTLSIVSQWLRRGQVRPRTLGGV